MRRTLYRVTQENSIENSVQDCLPYILLLDGPYKLFLAYPKWPYVSHVVWHHPFQNFLCLSICLVTCDHLCHCDWCDWVILILTLSSKNRKSGKWFEKKIRMRRKDKSKAKSTFCNLDSDMISFVVIVKFYYQLK